MSLRDGAIAALRKEWKRQTFIDHAALLDALLEYLTEHTDEAIKEMVSAMYEEVDYPGNPWRAANLGLDALLNYMKTEEIDEEEV